MKDTRLTVADYAVNDWVAFPTNHDTIADGVDGHQGLVVRVGRRSLTVSVEGETYVVDPTDVYRIND